MKKCFQIFIPVWFLIMTGIANAGDAEEIVFKDWALHSDQARALWILEQRVFLEGNDNTPLVHMGFQILATQENKGQEKNAKAGTRKRLWLTLRVPLGVQLGPGLHLQVDDGEIVIIPLHHCRADGCIALTPLQAEWRRRLEAGTKAQVSYQLLNGQRLSVPISLMGVKAGLAGLDKKMKAGK